MRPTKTAGAVWSMTIEQMMEVLKGLPALGEERAAAQPAPSVLQEWEAQATC